MLFFPTSWHSGNDSVTVYGLEENNPKASCVRIKNCFKTIYVKLQINNQTVNKECLLDALKQNCSGKCPIKNRVVTRRVLRGVHINPDGSPKVFDFLEMTFQHSELASIYTNMLTNGIIVRGKRLKFEVCNSWIELWFQLALRKNLPICDWIEIEHASKVEGNLKYSKCENEWVVEECGISTKCGILPPPKISVLAYDIEVSSLNRKIFPVCTQEYDKVFQVSMIMNEEMHLITRSIVDQTALQERFSEFTVTVHCVKSETALLEKFVDILVQLQPLIIIGYNNTNFDGPYMIERAKSFGNCWPKFEQYTLNRFIPAKERNVSWSSAAHSDQNFTFMSGEGFATLDLMTLLQRDYKMSSYKLDSVAKELLGEKKDDMDHLTMNNIYWSSLEDPTTQANIDGMTQIGAYCLQDSLLVLKILSNLKLVNTLIAMSTITNCKLEDLSVRGQQHKVISLIVRFCNDENVLVNLAPRKEVVEGKSYRGATVFEPVLGVHENVSSLDFESLYPSIIRANNMCPSTLVTDEKIPDSDCLVLDWEDHVKCEHDPALIEFTRLKETCKQLKIAATCDYSKWKEFYECKLKCGDFAKEARTFCHHKKIRWYKKYEGIYPKILKYLLDERKKVRRELVVKKNGPQSALTGFEIVALNAKQLAMKVCANSMYGFTGSQTSPLPCEEIAMCTTYTGREVIQKASKIIEEYGGVRVYGDTDSCYVRFPQKTHEELSEYSEMVAKKVSEQFPDCLNIVYEGEIYKKWLICSKKMYMYEVMNKDGSGSGKIKAKGCLLVRRDNCDFVKHIFERSVRMIFDEKSKEEIVDFFFSELLRLIWRCVPPETLTITKSVHSWAQGEVISNGKKSKMGNYAVRQLPITEKERASAFSKACVDNELDYYYSYLPAHVQLAVRMNQRGVLVSAGERIRFLVSQVDLVDQKLGLKCESLDWFLANSKILDIDFLHYAKQAATALDKLLRVVFPFKVYVPPEGTGLKKFSKQKMAETLTGNCTRLFLQMKRKHLAGLELKRLFAPKFVFE